VASTCECGDEHSVSMTCGEFLDWLRAGWLLKKDCAPWSERVIKLVYFLPRNQTATLHPRQGSSHYLGGLRTGVNVLEDRKFC
jgi:hypothetical protein